LNSNARQRGFTLIELMIVVAMIGVIAAIVFPRLDPFLPQRRLKSAARLLSGTISLAYGEAIAKNSTYRLYMDSSTDEYWITEVKALEQDNEQPTAIGIRIGTRFELLEYTDGSENVEENLPSEPMFARRRLPPGVHFSSVEVRRRYPGLGFDTQYIEFNPLGVAGAANISLANDDGEGFAVIYDGVTGIPVLAPIKDGAR